MGKKLGMVVYSYNSSVCGEEAVESPPSSKPTSVHSEFHASQSYIVGLKIKQINT